MRILQTVVSVLAFMVSALGEGTHMWRQSKYEEFQKGTSKGVAIRSDGSLELAPSLKPIHTTPSTYIWDIAADAQGNVYAAAGSPARVYRIQPDGKTSTIFEPQELQVQALVIDPKGVVYAATSPDGKVYRVEHKRAEGEKERNKSTPAKAAEPEKLAATTSEKKSAVDPAFTSSIFYDPQTKYIWDLALDTDGNLYTATGDRGEIFRVTPGGQHSAFFKSDEAHIRVLAFDREQNLIAGSDGSGLIYRISPRGEGFVLYSAPKKEITALVVDAQGNIYAAATGEKRGTRPSAPSTTTTSTTITVQSAAPVGSQTQPQAPIPAPSTPAPVPSSLPPLPQRGGAEIYRIMPDGTPRRLWSSQEDLVYSLAFDSNGQLLAGSGNKGRIYAIRGEDDFTDLQKVSANQVTAFAKAVDGGLYASTSNLGKIFLLSSKPEAEGTFESDVFDANHFSRWGRAEVRGAGKFELFARSGNVDNPDRNWSPWAKVDLDGSSTLELPAARFVQWKAVLRPGDRPGRLESVALYYRPKNVAPVIDDVIVQVGMRFQATSKPVPSEGGPGASSTTQRFEAPPPSSRDRNSVAVRWVVRDENDDDLRFSVYYRGDGETRWKLLKEDLAEKFHTIEAGTLPDGGYSIRVIASDAPSNSPDETLTTQKDSARFEIDTTPPRVQDLNAALDGDNVQITFRANDSFSTIKRAEYSIDAGEWRFVEPVGQLADSHLENYDFTVPKLQKNGASRRGDNPPRGGDHQDDGSNEHVVVVRVFDQFDNMGSAKVVVRR